MKPLDWNITFQTFISRFTDVAIPFFFLISGFLFFYNIDQINDCLAKLKKRLSTLLIPYLTWNILLLIFCFALSTIPALAPQIKHTYRLEYSLYWIITKLTYKPIVGQFWYIRTLLIFMFFSPLYLYAIKSRICSLPIILLALALWSLIDTNIVSTEGACFFLIGGFLAYHSSLPNPQPVKLWIWLLPLQMLIFSIILFTSIKYVMIRKFCILAQIYTGWQISLYLAANSKICHYLVDLNHHSFFIYATHGVFLRGLSLFFSRILPHTQIFSFITYLTCCFLTLILSFSLSFSLKRITPRIYSILNGGR